jgi:hypothetical protein
VPHHFVRVGSQITGCSNLYPLNASQSVSKIRLLVFTVSCFTVNKRAHNTVGPVGFRRGRGRPDSELRWSSSAPLHLFTSSTDIGALVLRL